MIIITSSVPLIYWYKGTNQKTGDYFDVKLEDLNQLYRRISCYVKVTEKDVFVYDEGLDEFGKPKGLPIMYKNEVYNLKKSRQEKFDFASAFNKILEQQDVESELLKNKKQ